MLNEQAVLAECIKFITDSKNSTNYKDQKDRARLNQDFYRGGKKQWTEEEYEIYATKGITPVSINRCKPVIKSLMGMYLQNRQDVKVRPRHNGTHTVSRVWTEIMQHTQDVSYADYVYASLLFRGTVDTESYLKLHIDRTENINGQPKIFCRSINDVVVDRNAIEYDLNESAMYIIEKVWQDKQELEAEYPEKEKAIEHQIGTGRAEKESLKDSLDAQASWMSGEGDIDFYDDEEDLLPDIEYLKKYRYLKHLVYWKEVVPALVVIDTQEKSMNKITDEKKVKKLSRKATKSKRFKIIHYAHKVLHETHLLGNSLLRDVKDPLGEGISLYPIVRYSPLWDDGYASGALDDVVDLNKEENIHRTQTMKLLNQTANSGWIVGNDDNPDYINLLKDYGSVDGIVLSREKYGGFLEKIVPNQLSAGHYTMASQFELDNKRVSGVDDAVYGYDTGKVESGIAIGRKQQGSRQTNDIYFDNLYRTLEIFGNMMLEVIITNDFYTDEEIVAIVGESGMIDTKLIQKAEAKLVARLGAELPEPMMLQPLTPETMMMIKPEDQPKVLETVRSGIEDAAKYQKVYPRLKEQWDQVVRQHAASMLLQDLRNDKKGQYGVKVTVSSSAPTERLARLAEIEAIQDKYGIIPIDIFIDATDLPNKDEIKARLQQQQMLQQQMQSVSKGAA